MEFSTPLGPSVTLGDLIFVFPILVSFSFTRKPVLRGFVFSDECLLPSDTFPRSIQYVLSQVLPAPPVENHLFLHTAAPSSFCRGPFRGGPRPSLSNEVIILTERCQSEGRSVSDVVRGPRGAGSRLVARLPRQLASLLEAAILPAAPAGTASFL